VSAPITARGVFGLRPGAIEQAAVLLRREDPVLTGALGRLLAQADEALSARPASVFQKQQPAVSEDPHDYVSMAPYFWPDADATGGLPYVRRDGQLNPEANSDRYDKRRLMEMARNSEALALAYRFTGNDVYAACCARQLRTWFLDPATRMTPHLAYAQVIPGKAKGRSFGVLDGHYLLPAFDAAGLLRGSRYWSESDREQLVAWAAEFLRWLRTSRSGRKEARSQNNHGTLFDVQVAHLSLLVGDVELARQTAERAKKRRIARQIRPEGSQPKELSRTEAFFYSQYNLAALFKLATRAEHAGVDLWRYETAFGAGIRTALDFVVPYLENTSKPWPYQGRRQWWSQFYAVLSQARRVYGDERYGRVLSNDPGSATWVYVELIR
jgi:Alginate lyase